MKYCSYKTGLYSRKLAEGLSPKKEIARSVVKAVESINQDIDKMAESMAAGVAKAVKRGSRS